jgi:hypothetical protein
MIILKHAREEKKRGNTPYWKFTDKQFYCGDEEGI